MSARTSLDMPHLRECQSACIEGEAISAAENGGMIGKIEQ
jgi:hypothetical protein